MGYRLTHCRSDLAYKWLQTRRLKTRFYSYAAFFQVYLEHFPSKGETWQHLQSSCRMQTPARASVAAWDRPIGTWGGFMSRWKTELVYLSSWNRQTWEVCSCREVGDGDATSSSGSGCKKVVLYIWQIYFLLSIANSRLNVKPSEQTTSKDTERKNWFTDISPRFKTDWVVKYTPTELHILRSTAMN